jgi:hypothetical protein
MSEAPIDRDNEYADIILCKNNQIKKQQEEIARLKAKNKELVMHLSNMMECTVGFAPSTRFIVNAREALAKEELDK